MGRKSIATVAGIGAAAVALTLSVTLARGGDAATAEATEVAGLTASVAQHTGSDNGDDGDLRAQIRELMADDRFRDDVAELRERHAAAMDEWWDEHGDDPDSDAAREARRQLREEHRAAMNELLEEHGIDTSAIEEGREQAQAAREKIRELMADDDFRADLGELRDQRQAGIDEWWDEYGDEPRSDEAREAMRALRDEARSGMKELLEDYGVDLPDRGGPKGLGGLGGGLLGPGGPGGLLDGGDDHPPTGEAGPEEPAPTLTI